MKTSVLATSTSSPTPLRCSLSQSFLCLRSQVFRASYSAPPPRLGAPARGPCSESSSLRPVPLSHFPELRHVLSVRSSLFRNLRAPGVSSRAFSRSFPSTKAPPPPSAGHALTVKCRIPGPTFPAPDGVSPRIRPLPAHCARFPPCGSPRFSAAAQSARSTLTRDDSPAAVSSPASKSPAPSPARECARFPRAAPQIPIPPGSGSDTAV